MIRSVLIANRGEIALRISRTLRKLSIDVYVLYDEREKNSRYVKEADKAFSLGSGPLSDTFLNIPKIISISKESACDALHPGYGFLSENPDFAQKCKQEGILFIGPEPEAIRLMGNKNEALKLARQAGVPILPGIYGTPEEILKAFDPALLPCLIKASSGGGGKAMHILQEQKDLTSQLNKSAREALKYFGDGSIYLEKYISHPRHIEVQILADTQGKIIHLYERECSLQRRYQKVIEEAPCISIPDELKKVLYADAIKIAQQVHYTGAGTVEFLVDGKGKHYFLEMNTRIQVEHGVTEEITGIDIVEEQVKIAQGNPLNAALESIPVRGHAIEVRLYAENPAEDFKPSPGKLTKVKLAEGDKLRLDSGIQEGDTLELAFDPMLAKIIAFDSSRPQAISRLVNALQESVVQGVETNRDLLIRLLEDPNFQQNSVSTRYIDSHWKELLHDEDEEGFEGLPALVGLELSLRSRIKDQGGADSIGHKLGFWRLSSRLKIRMNKSDFVFYSIRKSGNSIEAKYEDRHMLLEIEDIEEGNLRAIFAGKTFEYSWSWNALGDILYLSSARKDYKLIRSDWLVADRIKRNTNAAEDANGEAVIRAPLNGTVVKVNFGKSDSVNEGDSLLVIESMKMENEIRLPHKGVIKQFFIAEGELVSEGDILLELESIR